MDVTTLQLFIDKQAADALDDYRKGKLCIDKTIGKLASLADLAAEIVDIPRVQKVGDVMLQLRQDSFTYGPTYENNYMH